MTETERKRLINGESEREEQTKTKPSKAQAQAGGAGGAGPGGGAERSGRESTTGAAQGDGAGKSHLLCGAPGPGRLGPFIEEAAVAVWQAAGGF